MLQKITQVRTNSPVQPNKSIGVSLTYSDYKNSGMNLVVEGEFDSALSHFVTATLLKPDDSGAWNFRTYA